MSKIEELLTETEAAKILGITYWTIRRWRRDGKLSYYRIGGRYFYSPVQLEEFIQSCKSHDFAESDTNKSKGSSKATA